MTPRSALLATALALTACAPVGPDYSRPSFDLPQAYPDAASTVGEAPVEQLRADWWKLYGDTKLDELVVSSLERNSDVRLAVARIEEADANLRVANAAFLPEIDIGTVPNRTLFSNTVALPTPPGIPLLRNDIRATATTSFELDFWGKLRRSAESVRAQALGTRYAKDVVALTLAGLTAQTYFSLRSLESQVAVTRQTLASREQYLDFIRKRAAGGIASGLDVAQAEASLADSSSQLKDLLRQRALAEHLLGTLTGRLDIAVPGGDLLVLPVPPLPPADLPSTLLERRPDILQAEQTLVSSNAQIGVARAAMLPTFSLTGSDGWESAALSSLFRGPSRIWSLAFPVSFPLFDAGRYEALTDAAKARAQQSVAAYQKSIETAFREVADALTNAQQTAAAEEDYRARVQSARNALRLARMRYEAGYSAYLEVLDSERTANDAELAFVRNRQLRLSASVDLMKALGGGWAREKAGAYP
jgi:outer membrane protein, multidrug efflux system